MLHSFICEIKLFLYLLFNNCILITGAGFGIMIPVSYTTFNCYFDKKRTAMMSANQTMSSMASITFPILVTHLLTEYGFRGTLALVMALDLHVIVAMLVMHPVEWHVKKNNAISDKGMNMNFNTDCLLMGKI